MFCSPPAAAMDAPIEAYTGRGGAGSGRGGTGRGGVGLVSCRKLDLSSAYLCAVDVQVGCQEGARDVFLPCKEPLTPILAH